MSVSSIEKIERHCPRHLNITPIDTKAKQEQWIATPFDATCLDRIFEQMNDQLKRYNPWEEWLYTSLYIIVAILAVVGNGIVVMAVIRKRAMRTNRNVFIVNLALSNLVLAITIVPFLWLPSIDFDFPYSRLFCKFANALPGSNIYCSTLTISAMAIDRYYSVRKMILPHSTRRHCFNVLAISAGIWVLSFLLNLPLLIYYDIDVLYVFKNVLVRSEGGVSTEVRSFGWRQCRILAASVPEQTSALLSEANIQLFVSLLQILFLYVAPLIVLTVFNLKLNVFIKTKQMAPDRVQSLIRREDGSGPGDSRLSEDIRRSSPPPRSSSNRCSMEGPVKAAKGAPVDKRTSVASVQQRRSRTTLLLIAMATSYAALWAPFTLVSMLIDFNILDMEANGAVIERLDQYCKFISILSICVNPFLYGFLNKNFQEEFNAIFYSVTKHLSLQRCVCKPPRRENNNRAQFQRLTPVPNATRGGSTTITTTFSHRTASSDNQPRKLLSRSAMAKSTPTPANELKSEQQ